MRKDAPIGSQFDMAVIWYSIDDESMARVGMLGERTEGISRTANLLLNGSVEVGKRRGPAWLDLPLVYALGIFKAVALS